MEKYIPCQRKKQKEAVVIILISDKIDLKIENITRNKEEHYVMIKESIQEEDITIVNVYAPNIGAPQYIRIGHDWAHTHRTYTYYYFSNTNSFKRMTEFTVGLFIM